MKRCRVPKRIDNNSFVLHTLYIELVSPDSVLLSLIDLPGLVVGFISFDTAVFVLDNRVPCNLIPFAFDYTSSIPFLFAHGHRRHKQNGLHNDFDNLDWGLPLKQSANQISYIYITRIAELEGREEGAKRHIRTSSATGSDTTNLPADESSGSSNQDDSSPPSQGQPHRQCSSYSHERIPSRSNCGTARCDQVGQRP